MSDYNALKISGYDYIEYAVADLDKEEDICKQMGFERAQTREIAERKLSSRLMVQNDIRFVLSQSNDSSDPVAQYVANHGPGVIDVGLTCEDASRAMELTVSRGAEVAASPKRFEKEFGTVETASIQAFGDVRHTFVTRDGNYFGEGFNTPLLDQFEGYGLQKIDHITTNVEQGKMKEWRTWYENVFGLKKTRFFDIHTDRTGLLSYVMESPDGVIKMPINEPTEPESQIQEFLDVHHGPGVQHLALSTNAIIDSLRSLRKSSMEFLQVPSTYYEALGKRLPNVTEDLSTLEELQILADGDDAGYLLQIFTNTVVGPFFFEVIQRKGNDGFGEGNFGALFEAIERDQIRRGVLKAPGSDEAYSRTET